MTKTAFIYTDEFSRFDYGDSHPLKMFRLVLTYELIKAYGLLSLPDTRFVHSKAASDKELCLFHESKYIECLKSVNEGKRVANAYNYGLGYGDNPIFKGLLDWSRLVTGASLQAAEMVDNGDVDIAFNIAGGLHHAGSAQASGFCYVNDPAVAIKYLLKKGKRVAYIDIDAHHGDGVQDAFYDTDRVLTISIHETGKVLFPGTGFETEIGIGEGEGYSINVPLPPYSDDEIFMYAFNSIIPPAIDKFKPDIVVTQLGADSFCSDPLSHLNLTSYGFCEAVTKLKAISKKWVALGGGGYDIYNVAKGWTLAWAIMNGVDLPDEIPIEFLWRYPNGGFSTGSLRGDRYAEDGVAKERMKTAVSGIIDAIHKKALTRIICPDLP